MLPTKFRVNWLLGLGKEAKNRFSRWLPWRPSWISYRNNFSYFNLQVTPMLPTVWTQLAFFFQEKKRKTFFQIGGHGGHVGFPIRTILAIFYFTSHPDASYQVSNQLAQGCRRSRLLKQLLTPHATRRTTDID